MRNKLPKPQRKLLSRLQKKHSYEDPFVTNDEGTKILLRELEELGHIECQWSQDWKIPAVFAWLPCDQCLRGICLGEKPSDDELVPFWSCAVCKRYDHDLDAATAVREFTAVSNLDLEAEHSFGFEARRYDAIKNNLAHHWQGRVRKPRAA